MVASPVGLSYAGASQACAFSAPLTSITCTAKHGNALVVASGCSSSSSLKDFFRRSGNGAGISHGVREFPKSFQPAQKRPTVQHFPVNGIRASGRDSRAPRPENVAGEFYVDHTCIDCDTCRWMAPEVFSRKGYMSAVHRQPDSPEDRMKALQSLLACPTASIHTSSPPTDIGAAHATFPLLVDPSSLSNVYHCGYHSKHSYGATSYFLRRPDGNILIDSPRYTVQLADRLDELGGVRYMFLSHRDDIADHAKWAARFQCQRILHEEEVQSGTAGVEMKLKGSGPWRLGPDVDLILTAGHTEGSVCLLYKPGKVLFSGDHLALSEDGGLSIFPMYNRDGVEKQLESVRKLLAEDFVWLLPGHGRRFHFESVTQKNEMLEELVHQGRGLVRSRR